MNQINVIGRLTRDPESRSVGNSTVVSFTLAAPTNTKDKAAANGSGGAASNGSGGAAAAYVTNFYRVEIWGKRGETILQYAKQGDEIAVSGELTLRKYKTTQGADAWSFDIEANSFTLLRKKGASVENSGGSGGSANGPQSRRSAPVEDEGLPF